jgi:peptide deformylase
LNGDVRRAQKVTVKGLNRKGEEITITGTDLLARAFQHEIDHLNGILFTELAETLYDVTERKGQE